MSFQLTTRQVRERTKTVTRRDGWEYLKPGELVLACEKCQGLRKGEKVRTLCVIRILNTRREPLNRIDQADCVREGFPEMTPAQFIEFFGRTHDECVPAKVVTRIEFEYVD